MKTIEKAREAVRLLELVATKKKEPASALSEWPDIDAEKDKTIAGAWHELSHYENDLDIRQRDPEYDEILCTQLLEAARRIREKFGISVAQ